MLSLSLPAAPLGASATTLSPSASRATTHSVAASPAARRRALASTTTTTTTTTTKSTTTSPIGATLESEGFSANATTPNRWIGFGGACLTAGNTTTPATSLPACGIAATQDANGQGALQLTTSGYSQAGMAISNLPVSTANGLQITFDDYAFNGAAPGADGMTLFLTDASKPLPTQAGQGGGNLAYASSSTGTGVANAYVGVGLDEYGGFSNVAGGPGLVSDTIAVRGAAATNYAYLGGAKNAAGKAASLPFALNQPLALTRPTNVPTIRTTLTPGGTLSVAVDRHDGNGFVMYYSQMIVGVAGQPAVPANVYVGLSAATGGITDVHQVTGLVVSALAPAMPAVTTLNETFGGTATGANVWSAFGDACLTAGTSATPATSVRACGTSANQDAAGQGALQLTTGAGWQAGMVVERNPIPTASGLTVTFTDYAFNGTKPGADGLALFLCDASQPVPNYAGQTGGSLGYTGVPISAGIPGAYVGIGFDEYGNFSAAGGGPGVVPETIAVRGALAAGVPYLGGAQNAAGVAASLPFSLDTPSATTRPATAPTMRMTLTPSGLLSVSIDRHDGAGFVLYYTQNIVGVNGEPAVPANVYVGFSAGNGGLSNVHQIGDVSIVASSTTALSSSSNNPPSLVSVNGSLVFNVAAQVNATTGQPQFVYNGSLVPPTLRLLPGDTLVVNLTNNLPTPPAGSAYTNATNLHYHGLHVSPQAPGDDSIDMLAAPGQSLHYSLQIPTNHPPGLYWYHSHAHGEAERQTLSGMSGALIIDGIASYTPQVANMIERVLVMRDAPLPGTALPNANLRQVYAMKWAMQHGIAMHAQGVTSSRVSGAVRSELHGSSTSRTQNPYAPIDPLYRRFVRSSATSSGDSHCVAGSPEAAVKALTVNGQTQPSLRIAPGEQQFWRVVNAGADTYLNLQVDNTTMQIVALDGVPLSTGVGTPSSMTVSNWVLPPASRVEFIVTGPPAGTPSYLRTNCFDAGPAGVAMPAAVLASLTSTASASTDAHDRLAGRVSSKARRYRVHTSATIRSTAVSATRTIYYSDQNNINGVAYDPAAPPQFYAQSGTVEEWTIVNNSSQVHTFHIHQVHFVLEAINGTTQAQQYVLDNVNVPAATASGPGSVKVLLDFTDPTIIGTFLVHCHILSHEDAGMMAKIRIGTAPPLGLSSTSVSFTSPSAALQKVTISGGAAPYSVTGCTGVASAAVSGQTISIAPQGAGACVLTLADASSPSITASLAITVAGGAAVMSLSPNAVSFAAPTASAQSVTIAGGTAPYTVSGCTGIARGTIAGAQLTVAPQATGTCSLTVSDSSGNNALLSVAVNAPSTGSPLDNLTFHGNSARTGWYANETTLTAANVGSSAFGQIATLSAPSNLPALGKVYAQPLFVTSEVATDGKAHNLVIVAGSTGQVDAFDETTHAVVWNRSFTNAAAGIRQQLWSDTGCADVNPDVGIVGTPVIDRSRDTLYVVVATMENGVPYTRLHAIGLGSGLDVVAPTVISGSVALATGGTASISSLNNMARAALLEANGNIYVTLGSHCDANSANVHGWVMAYSAATLAETGSLVDLTNASDGSNFYLGSVWMSGFGPAADAQGSIYFATGNGPYNGTTNFGMSVMKVPGNLNLAGASSFTPIQEAADSAADLDLGSGGVMVLPDQSGAAPHLLIAGGKCSVAAGYGCLKYILNRDALGGQQAGNAGALLSANIAGGVWGGPAYFVDSTGTQRVLYGGNPLTDYALSVAPYGFTATSSSNVGCLECRDQGSQPIVSSNGTQAGSAVAWALKTPGNGGGTIMLYAFNPLAMGTPLFAGTAGPWTAASGASYIGGALISPLVANGHVYVPMQGGVAVYGLH